MRAQALCAILITEAPMSITGKKMWKAFFISTFILLLFFCPIITLGAEDTDAVLKQSGIRYPDGYDVNTVGEVRGTARNFVKPEKGPVHFSLTTKTDTYTVFASPLWYWNDYDVSTQNGDEVVVTGSKSLGKDGNLYIIARELRFPGINRSLLFRGKEGLPLWKPFGTSTGRGGFGSPAGSKGGVGSGNAGRGKR